MLINHDTYLADRILREDHMPLTILPAAMIELEAAGVPPGFRDALCTTLKRAAGYQSKDLLLVEEHADAQRFGSPGWRVYLPCLWPEIRDGYNPVSAIASEATDLLRNHPVPGMLVSEGDGLYLARIVVSFENEPKARRWLSERLGNQSLRRKLASLAVRARRMARSLEEVSAEPVVYLHRLVERTLRTTSDLDVRNPVLLRRMYDLVLDLREARLHSMCEQATPDCAMSGELAQIAAVRHVLEARSGAA